MILKFFIDGKLTKQECPHGYRRVPIGYTRPGDLSWDGTQWVAVDDDMRLVNRYSVVIRPKKVAV